MAAFHAGEQALQARAGAAQRLAEVGPRVLRDHMPQQHREFFAQLPFVLLGLVDDEGQPWASILAGQPGFVHSPDPRSLRVQSLPAGHDPIGPWLRDGAPVGLLGIEPHSRRRNRMNGRVHEAGASGFSVQVGQSFGNCPKYIHARRAQFDRSAAQAGPLEAGEVLDAAALAQVRGADTFFIATSHPLSRTGQDPSFGVDVSHRGGPAGFVRVDGDVLTVPDFAGNLFFNTLGNLALQPRCGLLFADPAGGDCLWIAAHGEVAWEGEELRRFAGAQRLLRLRVRAWRRVRGALPLRWFPGEPPPELERLGRW